MIAIVGMAGRFPGSDSVDALWRAVRAGAEGISVLSDTQLRAAGVDPALVRDPSYVRARGVIDGIEMFDAGLFGFSPREAELTDPQHRLFLECAWTALEDAGHCPDFYDGSIGVYAGTGWSSYMLFNLASQRGLFESEAGHQALLGNDKDNLTTRVSYKLDLTGPSVTVQTGCSTSLVAVALACTSLSTYQCDLALAGGVSIMVPQGGYMFRPGGILSPDGHCRAFDAGARGTVLGSGAAVVVLKRLEDALAARDHVYAVIRGAAINNDGARKLGYTAPSVDGQARVIVEAHAVAGVAPETIGYVEAHGTGTVLGDPIEVAALTKAFRDGTSARGFCALGSVKTNVGHLDAAAGVTGLVKTALAVQHGEIPPSLHFSAANPEIDFAASPFRVATALAPWPAGPTPRRAGVSSFGLGGTNAHAVVEEAPGVEPSTDTAGPRLVVMSARTPTALDAIASGLAAHLRAHPELALGDVAHTLQIGRKALGVRGYVVARDRDDAIAALEAGHVVTRSTSSGAPSVAFVFAGQGTQRIDMGRDLYTRVPAFRQDVDACFEILTAQHGLDLRATLYPDGEPAIAAARMRETEYAQPALFVLEYALARMWMSLGVAMSSAIGHSLGEYVAATLAGVFSLDDALRLVTMRGRLMQKLARGAMLAVPLAADELAVLLGPGLSVGAINERTSSVAAGSLDEIARLEQLLDERGVPSRRLETSHAFHSPLTEPMLPAFRAELARVHLRVPAIPFVSNVTGTWITDAEATDPEYWLRHIRQPVAFATGLTTLLAARPSVVLEIGPSETLGAIARRHPDRDPQQLVVSTLPSELAAIGQLWLAGAQIKWSVLERDRAWRRVRLPTYPFERQSYWVEPTARDDAWEAFVAGSRARAEAEVSGLDLPAYAADQDRIAALSAGYAVEALRRLGAFEQRGPCHTIADVLAACNVVPRFHQVAAYVLGRLLDGAAVRWDDGALVAQYAPAEAPRDSLMVARIRACGEALPAILRGEHEPLELFSTLLADEDGQAHADTRIDDHYREILRAGLAQLVARTSRPLRVIELGGGTAIATRTLLSALPAERTQYTFTDVSKALLTRARDKLAGHPNVAFGLLDIDRPPEGQGYAAHGFDVVVAVNVLHVGRSIGAALAHARSLLASGGLLVIWEITKPTLDFALTYGLLMRALDDGDRNQGNPFLSCDQWSAALAAHGFARVAVLPASDAFGQHVFVAQADAAERPATRALFAKKPDVADWFYVPSWKRSTAPAPARAASPGPWLIALDRGGVGNALAGALEQRGHRVTRIPAGEPFWEHLARVRPRHVVVAGDIDAADSGATLRGVMKLAQAVGDAVLADPIELTVLSQHQHAVIGEEPVVPERALAVAATRVIPLEYPNVTCRSIDVAPSPVLVEQLVRELEAQAADAVVAYRGPHRWVPIIEPVRLPPPDPDATRLKHGGVYLITGGYGRIGLTIAEYLARTVAAKLILVGRTQRSTPEALGDVMAVTADVADFEQMRGVITAARARFGAIDGVIHAAGVLGDGGIQRKTWDEVEAVLRAKVAGTTVLDALFRDHTLDFFVVFSSLSAVKPGFGQLAYAAANAFLDAYVHADRRHRFVASIGWDVWQGEGMAYDATAPSALESVKRADFARRGIVPHEGVEVFRRVVGGAHPHVLVSTSDYLMSDVRDLSQLYVDHAGRNDAPPAYVRPSLAQRYVAVAGDTERSVAVIWEQILGIRGIGAEDDFFELGGDSLIGTQLVTRVKAAFGITLPARSVYQHRTIRALALVVEEALIAQSSPEELDAALAKIGASDE